MKCEFQQTNSYIAVPLVPAPVAGSVPERTDPGGQWRPADRRSSAAAAAH